jgi:hypothetical protein
VTFTRRDATESYFVAVNLTDADQTVTLTNAVASATLAFGEGTLAGDTLTVPASGHAIFALK